MVPGLLAAGEAACASVHGANRLGANSLLDIVVFGRACANTVSEVLKPGAPLGQLPADAGDESIARMDGFRNASGSLPTASIRGKMQRVMQNDAAVFRTQVRALLATRHCTGIRLQHTLVTRACTPGCAGDAGSWLRCDRRGCGQ